ncbi:hypothetical protein DFH29DRAFT_1004493 [Suillus ampliporus]|nr:hypothetical protein DFH29DRAFT_1004493 [Suillus ampliporus]
MSVSVWKPVITRRDPQGPQLLAGPTTSILEIGHPGHYHQGLYTPNTPMMNPHHATLCLTQLWRFSTRAAEDADVDEFSDEEKGAHLEPAEPASTDVSPAVLGKPSVTGTTVPFNLFGTSGVFIMDECEKY